MNAVPVVKNASAVVQGAAFLSVRKKLVCIDDLERKGAQLSIKDVLGLISHLRTEKECKVVLILNDGALDKSDADNLERFREKVIDNTIEFAPTPEECVSIALTEDESWSDDLKRIVSSLGLSNIRIIRKIAQSCKRVCPLLKNFHPQVAAQAIMTFAVLGWSVYDLDVAPTFEFLMHKRPAQALGFDKEEITEKESFWNSILDEIGFTDLDEFDLVLYNSITQGILDEARLLEQARVLQKKFEAGETDDAFERAWRLFHDGLEDNEAEVVESIFESFCNNVQYVTPLNMNGTVALLKNLGAPDKAQDALNVYMAEREEPSGFFDLDSAPFLDRISVDEDVKAAFDLKFSSLVTEDSEKKPAEILLRIAKTGAWSRSDITVLSQLTVEDLLPYSKGPRGRISIASYVLV